jgi:hypothetical protein
MPTCERRAKTLGLPIDQLPDGRGKGRKAKGEEHPRWNDGRMLSEHGYVKVRVGIDNPLADSNGYAYEHLLVWCEAGRVQPDSSELLHHKNEDKTDNRISNLELLTRREHAEEHHRMVPDKVVREIRVRYAAGEDGMSLAKEFDLPWQRVYRFIHGETRLGAGGPIQTGNLRGKKEQQEEVPNV